MRTRTTSRLWARRTVPLIAAGGAVALISAVLTGPAQAHAARPGATVPTGTKVLTAVLPHLDGLTDLGPVSPTKAMTIGVTIPGDTAGLKAAEQAIQDPSSPRYQVFMTPQQIAKAYGVPATVSKSVQGSLEAHGLRPVYISADGSYVELSGTAAAVEKTFSVGLENYSSGSRTFYANTLGATVPAAVSAVAGLTNLTDFATHADQDTCVATMCTGVVGPTALWSAYDMPNESQYRFPKNVDKGQGEKVAIFGEGDLTQVVSDLRQYETETTVATGVTKPVLPPIPVRETLVNDDQTDTAGLGEWDLDSQSSTGMAPDLAELDFYFGQDLSDAAIDGIYSAWVNDPKGPTIGNSSFGGCEPLEALFGDETTDDTFFTEAVMEGRTMFASTGDTGSGGCVVGVDLNGVGNGGAPAVEYPAASPYVVAVGGTVLYTAASGGVQTQPATRSLEYAWTYTGGGYSDYEPQPADQAGLGGALPNPSPCIGTPSGGAPTGALCRTVPDVAAMSGDIATNGYGIVSDNAQTETGGTSLSSPLWAGIWARIEAVHGPHCTQSNGNKKFLGFAQPLLYNAAEADGGASDFFDVGGIANSQPTGNGSYTALPRSAADPTGYDLVSGLGVPDVNGLIRTFGCENFPFDTRSDKIPHKGGVTIVTPTMSGCPANGTYSDVSGDESPADTAIDLTYTKETGSATGITFTSTVAALPESNPAFEDLYDWQFTYAGASYEVEADAGNALTPPSYTLYSMGVDPTGMLTTTTSLGTITGSFNNATGVVSAVLPYDAFNTDASPTTPLAPGATLTGLFIDTQVNGYSQVNYSDSIAFGPCTFSVQGGTAT